uniref:RNase adapter RapZ n=1 Tax=Fervidobacterium nodosum TaxID=2424 RepID=A0A7C5Y8V5_9BACT
MKELVILTGHSGAGKSTAAGLLEDLGFFCIDNLPPEVVYQVASILSNTVDKLAIVLDVRSFLFGNILKAINDVKERYPFTKVVFLTATKDTLIQRFAHTRRSHPLSKQTSSIGEAIDKEIDMMKDVMEVADLVIDTTMLNPHQLREKLTKILEKKSEKVFVIHIISFGFKYGIPLDADFVFDVRFFPNPFYITELRSKTGKDPEVKEFLRNVDGVSGYLQRMMALLKIAISRYETEGRKELTVAVGCTGGRHRSVYFAEELAGIFEQDGYKITLNHRDVDLG